MRKIVAILISFILCFNIAGYYFVFKVRQLQIKSEIKQLLKSNVPTEQLVVIRYSASNRQDFKWIHSREFVYRGSMYDVVRKVVVSNEVTDLYCVNDTQEARLFKNLDRWVKEAMNHGKEGTKVLHLVSGFLSGLYPPPDNLFSTFPVLHEIRFQDKPDFYFYQPEKIPSPPPRS